eukprot:scaffold90679_cov69-Phaeocystis_antarctica.AAC.2
MVVVSPAQPAYRGERTFNVQRRRHEVDRSARAAASSALLVVAVVAAAARAAATLEASGQLGIAIGRPASRCQTAVLPEALGAGKSVAGATRAWRHAAIIWAARGRARTRARIPRLARATAAAAAATARDADASSAVARAGRPRSRCAKESLTRAAAVAAVAAISVDCAGRADRDGRGGDLERAAARTTARGHVVASGIAAFAARDLNRTLDVDERLGVDDQRVGAGSFQGRAGDNDERAVAEAARRRIGRQKHRQPLQRAGTAVDRRTQFRARPAHGMRVVDVQPVHDDCLRRVATVLVGLVGGVAEA